VTGKVPGWDSKFLTSGVEEGNQWRGKSLASPTTGTTNTALPYISYFKDELHAVLFNVFTLTRLSNTNLAHTVLHFVSTFYNERQMFAYNCCMHRL